MLTVSPLGSLLTDTRLPVNLGHHYSCLCLARCVGDLLYCNSLSLPRYLLRIERPHCIEFLTYQMSSFRGADPVSENSLFDVSTNTLEVQLGSGRRLSGIAHRHCP